MKHVFILRHVSGSSDWLEVYSSLELARIGLKRLIKEYADEGVKMVRFKAKHSELLDYYTDEYETDLSIEKQAVLA